MQRPLVAALLLGAAPALAQTPEGFALDPVIVSGGLFPVAEGAFGRAVSVVTAEEIERRQIRHAADALRALPGVQVSGAGTSSGGPLQVRIRGAEGNHTKVLIDGIGSTYSFPPITRSLARQQVRVTRFLPASVPIYFPYANLRNHRKIMVVDGTVGFTGGLNIRDGCWPPTSTG